MPIDPLEIDRQALADFGRMVMVTPEIDAAFEAIMLYDEPDEDARIGHLGGNLSLPVFRCLPSDGERISRGTLLTMAGVDYVVFDPIPRHGALTEIRVKEQ